MTTVEVPYFSPPELFDSSRIQQIQEDDIRRRDELQEAIKFINNNITTLVKMFSPNSQDEIDENLM